MTDKKPHSEQILNPLLFKEQLIKNLPDSHGIVHVYPVPVHRAE